MSEIEYRSKRVANLTPQERKACRSLSYRGDGDLQWWLTEHDDAEVVMAWRDDRLLGWGMRLSSGPTGYYVRATERRKGIGAKLYYILNPPRIQHVVYPHDDRSAAFFYAVGKIPQKRLEQFTGQSARAMGVKRKPRKDVMVN